LEVGISTAQRANEQTIFLIDVRYFFSHIVRIEMFILLDCREAIENKIENNKFVVTPQQ
jgi:hypothetical protein